MKKIVQHSPYLILLLLALCGCSTGSNSHQVLDDHVEKESINRDTIVHETGQYLLKIERIDSMQFITEKASSQYKPDQFEKITDFNKAKEMLKDIAEFDESESEYPVVLHLRDRQNDSIEINDYYAFVAYYPEEDILLCGGGHTTDVSFNLKNGEGTTLTGNPEMIRSSPQQTYRLNGHFGGQQCSSYFLQKRTPNGFEKIIQLDDVFEKMTGIWLCVVGEAFWTNDRTLYLTEDAGYGIDTKYFKIEILDVN